MSLLNIDVRVCGEKMGGKRGRLFLFFDLGDIYATHSPSSVRFSLECWTDGTGLDSLLRILSLSFFFCFYRSKPWTTRTKDESLLNFSLSLYTTFPSKGIPKSEEERKGE